MNYTKKYITIIILTHIFTFGCNEKMNNSSSTAGSSEVNPLPDENDTAELESLYKKAVQEAMPKWKDSNVLSESNHQESFLQKHKDGGLNLAPLVTSEILESKGYTRNGAAIFTNKANSAALRVDHNKGLWKFVSPPLKTKSRANEFEDADSLQETEKLFDQLGLPANEMGNNVSVPVGQADTTPEGARTSPYKVARHTRIFRSVNGIPVKNSHLMVTYTFDGKPFRVEARWPEFKLSSNARRGLISMDKAISDIAQKFTKGFTNQRSSFQIFISLEYWFDEETATHDPTLIVTFSKDDESMEAAMWRYSLSTGWWEPTETDLGEDQ